MALRFIDSFDHYQTAQLTAKWTSLSILGSHQIQAGTGRCGTNALRMTSGAGLELVKGVPYSGLTGYLGFALNIEQQIFTSAIFVNVLSGIGSGVNLRFSRLLDGSLRASRADAGDVILGTSAPDVVRMNDWYYVEFKFVIDNVAGSVEIRVNGVSVLTVGPVDTVGSSSGAALTGFSLATAQSFTYRVDDLYALDNSGPAPTNDFLGDIRVEYLEPDGPGVHQDFALVGAATHWQAVDDGAAPDGDTSYIHTATAGDMDTETYDNTGLPAGAIFGVQIGVYARKTDSGFRELAPVVRHAGIDYSGANQAPSFASYTYLMQVFDTNPGTGLGWTIADVNGAEFGVRLSV